MNTKKKFVADGVFQAELNEFLQKTLGMEGYASIEIRATSVNTEIRVRAAKCNVFPLQVSPTCACPHCATRRKSTHSSLFRALASDSRMPVPVSESSAQGPSIQTGDLYVWLIEWRAVLSGAALQYVLRCFASDLTSVTAHLWFVWRR